MIDLLARAAVSTAAALAAMLRMAAVPLVVLYLGGWLIISLIADAFGPESGR